MTPIQTTVAFLSAVGAASDMGGHRGRLDIFADRLVKASSEPTLLAAMEQLLRSVNASVDAIDPALATAMISVASGPDGPRILRWWREQAKLVTLLAATRDQVAVDVALASVVLPEAHLGSPARRRGEYPITLRARCETPLSHGADGKAGNATLFRRMQVMTDDGTLVLPYYAGNAIRGQMRDLLADHFLAALGLPVSKSNPSVALWFFYAIYSGGALEEKSEATKALAKVIGDHGAIRSEGIRSFRDHLPGLSLLGCALGNRILPGHCQIADLRPVCAEWGTGDRPAAELMAWEYLTRREDFENHIEHHGMIANTEVLRVGAELEGGVDHDDAIPAIEVAALGRGLQLIMDRGFLGAENRRGFGRVAITATGLPDPAPYDAFLAAKKSDILAYLDSIGALVGLLS